MSRTYHHGERHIIVKGIRRDQPDLHRVARAIVELAEMRAEADAEAEHRHRNTEQTKRSPQQKMSGSYRPSEEEGKA